MQRPEAIYCPFTTGKEGKKQDFRRTRKAPLPRYIFAHREISKCEHVAEYVL
jgi:hypothetical protein